LRRRRIVSGNELVISVAASKMGLSNMTIDR